MRQSERYFGGMDELTGGGVDRQMVNGAGRPGRWTVRGIGVGMGKAWLFSWKSGAGCARLARRFSLFIVPDGAIVWAVLWSLTIHAAAAPQLILF